MAIKIRYKIRGTDLWVEEAIVKIYKIDIRYGAKCPFVELELNIFYNKDYLDMHTKSTSAPEDGLVIAGRWELLDVYNYEHFAKTKKEAVRKLNDYFSEEAMKENGTSPRSAVYNFLKKEHARYKGAEDFFLKKGSKGNAVKSKKTTKGVKRRSLSR